MPCISFAPPAIWYSSYLFPNPDGLSVKTTAAKNHANRCLVKGNAPEAVMLTIPVEGGGRILKHTKDLTRVKLSDHGNWRHTHLGALEACYGKTPYYVYLMDELQKVYDAYFESLQDFNNAIHKVIMTFMIGEMNENAIKHFLKNPLIKERGGELATRIDPFLSVIDALMTLGRDTLPALMALRMQPK